MILWDWTDLEMDLVRMDTVGPITADVSVAGAREGMLFP